MDAVKKTVHKFIVEGKVSSERVVILTPESVERSHIFQAGKIGNYTLVNKTNECGTNEIRVASLYRFKGLEADAIIVCDIKPWFEENRKKHLYVATSRARFALAIIRLNEN